MWDPGQYGRFQAERSRPFYDLLAQVPLAAATSVVDLGCGTGALTASLLERFPRARVVGVDNSPEMLATARPLTRSAAGSGSSSGTGSLEFVLGDVARWKPSEPIDLVISNAALQWVPGHLGLLSRFADWLAPGGVLAVQVPGNFAAPSHRLLRDLRLSPRWRDRLGVAADRSAEVAEPAVYLQALLDARLQPLVWETTYYQLLAGEDAVLEWMRGTALRPVLAELDASEQAEFLAELRPLLAAAYPPGPDGTALPFRRLFLLGQADGEEPR
jgi:trans-aconitate 2-methyltransferase